MNTKFIIVREKGKEKYTDSKLQGANVRGVILEAGPDLGDRLKKAQPKTNTHPTCYLIGSDEFCDAVIQASRDAELEWEFRTEFKDEDEVMLLEGMKFPEDVTKNKNTKPANVDQDVLNALDSLKGGGISRSDIAGVLMAAEELTGMKISPRNEETIYKAFLQLAENYIPDKKRAKVAVDFVRSKNPQMAH